MLKEKDINKDFILNVNNKKISIPIPNFELVELQEGETVECFHCSLIRENMGVFKAKMPPQCKTRYIVDMEYVYICSRCSRNDLQIAEKVFIVDIKNQNYIN